MFGGRSEDNNAWALACLTFANSRLLQQAKPSTHTWYAAIYTIPNYSSQCSVGVLGGGGGGICLSPSPCQHQGSCTMRSISTCMCQRTVITAGLCFVVVLCHGLSAAHAVVDIIALYSLCVCVGVGWL